MKLHRCWIALTALLLAGLGHATEVADLAAQKDLTPESVLRSCAEFKFELGAQPQEPEIFLQRRRGDCDDFAQLASQVLTSRGYHTKLVVVMMEKETHVVCYVQEARGYLDFNRRAEAHPVMSSDGSLEDIAQKVAQSFRSPWRMASEFRYENKLPRYLDNVFPLSTSTASVASTPRR